MIDERGQMDPVEQKQVFRRNYLHSVSLFLFIMAVVMGAYYIWEIYLDPGAREEAANTERYQIFVDNYETAMKADTYGGKTPEETLSLFIEALEKEDVELASKYFLLEQNETDPNYLTRKIWEEGLITIKDKNGIADLVKKLKLLQPSSRTTASVETVEFVALNVDQIEFSATLKRNMYSNVWKIESL